MKGARAIAVAATVLLGALDPAFADDCSVLRAMANDKPNYFRNLTGTCGNTSCDSTVSLPGADHCRASSGETIGGTPHFGAEWTCEWRFSKPGTGNYIEALVKDWALVGAVASCLGVDNFMWNVGSSDFISSQTAGLGWNEPGGGHFEIGIWTYSQVNDQTKTTVYKVKFTAKIR